MQIESSLICLVRYFVHFWFEKSFEFFISIIQVLIDDDYVKVALLIAIFHLCSSRAQSLKDKIENDLNLYSTIKIMRKFLKFDN